MIGQFTGWYFPEGQSARRPATVTVVEDGGTKIDLEDPPQSLDLNWRDFKISSRVGRTPRRLTLPDGAIIETPDNDAVDSIERQLKGLTRGAVAHNIERLTLYTGIFVIAFGVSLFAFFRWGVPYAAEQVAHTLPPNLMNSTGKQTLQLLDDAYFQPSDLKRDRRAELRAYFDELIAASDLPANCCTLLFRKSQALGANAFALPDGTVVMLDGMVRLATDDRQLIGVLAHELGHVDRRHIMQSVLQGAVITLAIVFVAGDLSEMAELALTVPALLVQTGYSRDFEREADTYGADLMSKLGHDPKHLADLFALLQKQCGASCDGEPGWLSTHPGSEERIKRLREKSSSH